MTLSDFAEIGLITKPNLSLREAAKICTYVSEEVRRQGDGPTDVGYMFGAWMHALLYKENNSPLTLDLIKTWGVLIDPSANKGFRTAPVYVGGEAKVHPNELPDRMERWINAVNEGIFNQTHSVDGFALPARPADYAYRAFEDIHPFMDGNGRTGKIILNWLNDSLREPVWPYNFWGISNP